MNPATRSKKQRLDEPKLVFSSKVDERVDEMVKALIEEWLVPALVEEYIRLKRQTGMQQDTRDTEGFS